MRESRQLPSPRPHWHGFLSVEDKHDRLWRNGRLHYWFGFGETPGREAAATVHVGFEWAHLTSFGGVGGKISTTGEETLDVHYGLGRLLRHYWSVDVERATTEPVSKFGRLVWPRRLLRLPPVRVEAELGVTQFRWCFGPNDHSWNSNEPLKDRIRRNDVHWFRGGWMRDDEALVDQVDTEVALPEGSYPVTVKLTRSVWRYQIGPLWILRRAAGPRSMGPRFTLPVHRRVQWHAELNADGGLPHPGKGESSYDCGQDALMGITAAVREPYDHHDREWVAEACTKAVGSVLRSRVRHGRSMADTGA